MDKVDVRFLESREVRDHSGTVETAFEAGKVYSLPVASADRWVRRGVAEVNAVDVVEDDAEPVKKKVRRKK